MNFTIIFLVGVLIGFWLGFLTMCLLSANGKDD